MAQKPKKGKKRMTEADLIRRVTKVTRGAVALTAADKTETPHFVRRPFGIAQLDKELAGGLPGGSLCQLHGIQAIGKNATAFSMIAENQRLYGEKSRVAFASFG